LFLAFTLLFFFTWIGGFWGIQIPNHHFMRFQGVLDQGKHVFFIDVPAQQQDSLMKTSKTHPKLLFAGTGGSMPSWIINLETKTKNWWYWRMWRNA
jgi:hypothetical protein